MKFKDLSTAQLKTVIKNYRLHLLKELSGYSKMSRDDLINLCEKLFDIDDEKIKPKITEPIYFDIPKGRKPKVEKMKKKQQELIPELKKPEPKPEPKEVKKLTRKEKEERELKMQQEREEYWNKLAERYEGLIIPDSDDEDVKVKKKKSKTKKTKKPIKEQKQTNSLIEYKKEPKPEPEPEKIKQVVNKGVLEELFKKRERIYNVMFKILKSPSKRSRVSLNKEFGLGVEDYDLIQKIFNARKGFDFIPTPLEFLQPMLKEIKERGDNTFLEPSCGLGFVIHHVLKVKPDINITAYEINPELMQLLITLFPKEYYPNITFYRKNFLEANENGNYSTIFCNPPFTNGGDSRYYINFFFECNRISKESKTNYHDNYVFFISPPLYPDMKPDTGIDISAIASSSYMNKKRIEDILNKEITNKEFNEYKKEGYESELYSELDEFVPIQIIFIDEIKFTAGTNFKANSYLCLNKSA